MVLGNRGGGLSIWYTTPGRWGLLPSQADQSYKGSEQPFLVLWTLSCVVMFLIQRKRNIFVSLQAEKVFLKVGCCCAFILGDGGGRGEGRII